MRAQGVNCTLTIAPSHGVPAQGGTRPQLRPQLTIDRGARMLGAAACRPAPERISPQARARAGQLPRVEASPRLMAARAQAASVPSAGSPRGLLLHVLPKRCAGRCKASSGRSRRRACVAGCKHAPMHNATVRKTGDVCNMHHSSGAQPAACTSVSGSFHSRQPWQLSAMVAVKERGTD